jgi:hypothetical protein
VSWSVGGGEKERQGRGIVSQIIPLLFKTTKQQENKEHLQTQKNVSALCKNLKGLDLSHSQSLHPAKLCNAIMFKPSLEH